MNPEMLWVFGLLLACVIAFVANRPRMDAVAMIALVALVLSGTLTMEEALTGFSEPSVILIAAFFIIGEGLVRTGVAFRVGDWLIRRAANNETRLMVLLMLAVAALGSVMSSTGVVALFIPVAFSVASRMRVSPGRLMMPLSFAGLISGMLTLVATPPNLVVNSEMIRAGYQGFGFFSFTPFGLLVLVMGIAYMLIARHWLVHDDQAQEEGSFSPAQRRNLSDFVRDYNLLERARRLYVTAESPLVGQILQDLQLRARYGANVLGIERQRSFGPVQLNASGNREILAGDIILVDFLKAEGDLSTFCDEMRLQPRVFKENYFTDLSREMGMAEMVIPPNSMLIGKTILELAFRSRYGLNVIGLRRDRRTLCDELVQEKLRMGDILLVAGPWKAVRQLQTRGQDFLVLTLPAEIDEAAPALRRAPFALLSLAITVALMISGVVPNLLAALIGCLLMGAFRCIDMESAYRSIHWQSLILIIGMLPFSLALQKTGGIDLIVNTLLQAVGDSSPRLLLASLFALTAVIGLFISNTATAVLMAPIGIATAQQLGVSAAPFAMTVAIAASAAFMTPVSSPVNTLVLGPGRYRFIDFVKIGVPFTLLVMAACIAVLPWLFPLG